MKAASTGQLTIALPGVPPAPAPVNSPVRRDRKAYAEECALRWSGECLRDARRNWNVFEENYETLAEIIRTYLRDNYCEDLDGKAHNPSGTLTAWLWQCSDANPWIWGFCAHYQKCHLRRGLIAYCKQVIGEIQADERKDT
ncbi:hypothetical protein OPIT5_03945 [Opitutaceae bacterium TAV5]|nr:hypothetical protein OPIT5_03945 [Opitutaceae bacterium TAV5]